MSRKNAGVIAVGMLVLGMAVIFLTHESRMSTPVNVGALKELRVLSWVGYEEPEVREPFEREFGVRLVFDTFSGGDKMFAKLSQAPELYDVVVVDPEYIQKLHSARLIQSLNPSDFDFSRYLEPFQHFPLCWIDENLWAVLIRYGTNALVYNTEHLSAEDVRSYSILWSEKVKGKVGLWDWYLPTMGVLSLAAGNHHPYQLGTAEFQQLEQKLDSLGTQVAGVVDSLSAVNSGLANGDFWLVPAVGEHAAAILAEQGHPIAWTIPDEGGIMWIETLAIPARSKAPALAVQYIKYMMRPHVQALMAWRRAYRSGVPSVDAIDLLDESQKEALHVLTPQAAQKDVEALNVRQLPTNPDGSSAERAWQDVWSRFKVRRR